MRIILVGILCIYKERDDNNYIQSADHMEEKLSKFLKDSRAKNVLKKKGKRTSLLTQEWGRAQ